MAPAEALIRQCPRSFRRRHARQHAIRIVEGEREERVPSDRYDRVRLDLTPGHEPEVAAGKADAAQVEDERHAAGDQTFRSNESAKREEARAAPAHTSINDVWMSMSGKPRNSNKKAAERYEDELPLW